MDTDLLQEKRPYSSAERWSVQQQLPIEWGITPLVRLFAIASLRDSCLSQRPTISYCTFVRCLAGNLHYKHGAQSMNIMSPEQNLKNAVKFRRLRHKRYQSCSDDRRETGECQWHDGHEFCASVTRGRNHPSLVIDNLRAPHRF